MNHSRLSVILLAGAAILIYCTSLHYAPIYLMHDEVVYALTARSIALTGRDLNGELLPALFHIVNRYGSYYVTPVVIYSTALFLKFLPFTDAVIRMPSALIGVTDVVLMYFVALRIFRRESLALAAATLLALTPAHFIHARIASDLIYPVPFALGWLLCLATFVDEDRPWMLFASTSILGIGMFSYLASVGTMPIFAALTALVLAVCRKPARAYVIAAAGFAWPLAALAGWLATHSAQYAELLRLYPVYDSGVNPARALLRLLVYFNFSVRINTYYEFFNPAFLFFSGDASILSSTRLTGVFLYPLFALLPIGMYRIVTGDQSPIRRLVLAAFLLSPVPAVLLLDVTIHRVLVMLPLGVLIATCGLEWLWVSKGGYRAAGVFLLALVLALFVQFHRDYMSGYRARSSFWFGRDMRGAFAHVVARQRPGVAAPVYLSQDILWIDSYWRLYLIQNGREDLLERTVYFKPKALDVSVLPSGTAIIADSDDAAVNEPVKRGSLRRLAMVSEPDGTPSFVVAER
jgi:4-amino-4-deoxy-L-arabinose transferase-like glycosyltransferase